MSLNPLVMAAHARGMGSLGSGPFVDPNDFINNFGQPPVMADGGRGAFDWNGFANTVGGTLSSIFGRNNTNNAAAQQLALLQAQQAANVYRTQGSNEEDDDDAGIGIKFESNHLKLGGAKIPYSLLMIGGVAVMLLQSPGFQRRGR